MNNKTCIVIVGPTAVGKTFLSIELAQYFATEIISADSRQCFKELNIGVAKPSEEELKKIHHYFINSHSVTEEVNAKVFEDYALNAAGKIFTTNDIAVMVGGTGLYVKVFCEGMDEMPVIDEEIKKNILTNYNKEGIEWLREQIEKKDPIYFSKGEIKNPQRMRRALEVKLSTGRSITEFQSNKKQKRNFRIIKIGIELAKEQLHKNINARVDKMIADGLLDEVRTLLPYKNLNALQTVGYKELFDHLEGKISLDEAIEEIKKNTRKYAKRQMTWFKKDKEINWFSPDDHNSILSFLK